MNSAKKIVLAGILFAGSLLSAVAWASDECGRHLGDCAFYLCRESQDRCGTEGYLIDFGYRYCTAYQQAQPRFTPEGREWMVRIRECLMEELEGASSRDPRSCGTIQETAIRSHFTCYERHDFCSLPTGDKLRLLWVARVQLGDPAFIRNLSEMAESCL